MFDIIIFLALCLPVGLVLDMTDAIVHNYISGFNSLLVGLVPDMIDTIVHNCIFGFNSLPSGLVPDTTDIYRIEYSRVSSLYRLL